PPLFDRAPSEVPAGLPDRSPLRPSGETDQRNAAALAGYSWEEMERDYILSLLEGVKWNIAAAARQAGIKRSTFTARMKRLGIRKS
ncbi:MAG: hydrogenase, partial [Deltaproteobacteria bacterium]|nr:hydrogenase [Deltaproteobacteria bacterium]